jgi:hypothetical protein
MYYGPDRSRLELPLVELIPRLALRDYLMPGEEIRFQSSQAVRYGNKRYQVLLSDRRILLFARRGTLFKNDDIVSQKLDELQGVKYTERGIFDKKGIIHVESFKAEMDLSGPAGEIKALYQQMMRFM